MVYAKLFINSTVHLHILSFEPSCMLTHSCRSVIPNINPPPQLPFVAPPLPPPPPHEPSTDATRRRPTRRTRIYSGIDGGGHWMSTPRFPYLQLRTHNVRHDSSIDRWRR